MASLEQLQYRHDKGENMNIQSETVRSFVLNSLENGDFTPGMRLPGSRKISEMLDISRPTVQNTLDTLVNEGILKSIQRSGLYVDQEWQSRRIRRSLHLFSMASHLPWLDFFAKEMHEKFPGLHITNKCREGAFEIVTTATAQAQQSEFVDLLPILNECYPDMEPFYTEQLKPFKRDGRLFALPFLFSPRIMACNLAMLKESGCEIPRPDWNSDDFTALISKLRLYYPADRIFPWSANYYIWMNFIVSSGGVLLDPSDKGDPVKFDSLEAVSGLRRYRDIRGGISSDIGPQLRKWSSCALSIIDRQLYCISSAGVSDDFVFLPIPGTAPEWTGRSIQATELFAVRRGSVDNGLCEQIISFLWSEKFQDKLASLKYGIPIRKSSAGKTFMAGSGVDAVFKQACAKLHNDYNLESRALFDLIAMGISKVISNTEDIDFQIAELASTARNYIKYTNEKEVEQQKKKSRILHKEKL